MARRPARGMFLRTTGRRNVHWTIELINSVKQSVKRELDALAAQPKRRLSRILARVRELEDSPDPTAQLQCFVYIVSAMVQHQQAACLTPAQIDSLFARAYIILHHQGVNAQSSHHSFLYGDLHQVRSLIYRSEGQQWRSAWEQQVAEFLSRSSAFDQEGFFALALGNRALRLGHTALAYREFLAAEAHDLDPKRRLLARINRVRILRLRGAFPEARALLAESLAWPDAGRAALSELRWESLCLDLATSGEIAPLLRAVGAGREHHQPAYMIEAFLMAAASRQRTALAKLGKMKTLARSRKHRAKGQGFLLEAAIAVEECYDTEIPLTLRLARLGDALARAGALLNVDKEMLLWAAATRWLARIHSFKLAVFTLMEYESLSLRASDGNDRDCLRLCADLSASEWFSAAAWTAPARLPDAG